MSKKNQLGKEFNKQPFFFYYNRLDVIIYYFQHYNTKPCAIL